MTRLTIYLRDGGSVTYEDDELGVQHLQCGAIRVVEASLRHGDGYANGRWDHYELDAEGETTRQPGGGPEDRPALELDPE